MHDWLHNASVAGCRWRRPQTCTFLLKVRVACQVINLVCVSSCSICCACSPCPYFSSRCFVTANLFWWQSRLLSIVSAPFLPPQSPVDISHVRHDRAAGAAAASMLVMLNHCRRLRNKLRFEQASASLDRHQRQTLHELRALMDGKGDEDDADDDEQEEAEEDGLDRDSIELDAEGWPMILKDIKSRAQVEKEKQLLQQQQQEQRQPQPAQENGDRDKKLMEAALKTQPLPTTKRLMKKADEERAATEAPSPQKSEAGTSSTRFKTPKKAATKTATTPMKRSPQSAKSPKSVKKTMRKVEAPKKKPTTPVKKSKRPSCATFTSCQKCQGGWLVYNYERCGPKGGCPYKVWVLGTKRFRTFKDATLNGFVA
jgi:hypothetical protein